MNEHLEPCPFCGGMPEIRSRKTVIIECQQCGAMFIKTDMNTAVQYWNRRTQERTLLGDYFVHQRTGKKFICRTISQILITPEE